MVMDAGRHGKVTGLEAYERIPEQVLTGVPEASLRRMRPDILLFERGPEDPSILTLVDLRQSRHRQRCIMHIIEVGYCMEVGYLSKYQEKHAQHQKLIGLLKDAGYADVQLHLLIFGNTGGMFHLTALHLRRLGVAGLAISSLLEKLHFKALKRLEQIVGTRRKLEHEPDSRKRKRES